jgi:PncC family amidohydrolase
VKRSLTLSVAESCTGGTFASMLTALPGASRWLKEALVVYSIDSKVQRLGIPLVEIHQHGVVSSHICKMMSEKTKIKLNTDLGIGITGSAGPDTYSNIPIGLAYIALSTPEENFCNSFHFYGSRLFVQEQAAQAALDLLYKYLTKLESSI